LSKTDGVQFDIPIASQDVEYSHVFVVASQCGCSETSFAYTPEIGEAMTSSRGDDTQGPHAQRTNPVAFELVTAFLTLLGFNMLNEVLPTTGGKTYEENAPIAHGYLSPNDETIVSLTNEFKENYFKAEYVCYTSRPESWKDSVQPVRLLLQAAPAIGYAYSLKDKNRSDELQKYAALANYLTLFMYGVELATRINKKIVLHVVAVGGGVFKNKVQNVQWGFEKAALAFEEKMYSANVRVQLEAMSDSSYMFEIAKNLNIPYLPRIGDPPKPNKSILRSVKSLFS